MSDTVLGWLSGGWFFGSRRARVDADGSRLGSRSAKPDALPADAKRRTEEEDAAAGRRPSEMIGGCPAAEVLAALGTSDAIVAGDAFRLIYETYFPDLYRFASRLLGSSDSATDIIHNIFAWLWYRRQSLAIRGSLRVYLMSAVRRDIYDAARHRTRVERLERQAAQGSVDVPALGRIPSPDTSVEHAELDRALDTALATLAARDREILRLRWVEELTYDDIAVAFGISTSRVRTILSRATVRVARVLREL